MATKIETLKKPNGDQVLPRTRAKAVSMENGTTVETAIAQLNTDLEALQKPSDGASEAVLYVEQTLSDSQKTQARANIGAVAQDEIDVLPKVTPSDAGKFMRVSASGQWVAEAVPIAEEVEF